MRGRKKKPEELKIYKDSRSLVASSVAASVRITGKTSKAPAHLQDAAKKKWVEVCKELSELNILRPADNALIEMYCQLWADWVRESDAARKEMYILKGQGKRGGAYQNVRFATANKIMELMIKIGEQLGLSPTARTRIVSVPKSSGARRVDSWGSA